MNKKYYNKISRRNFLGQASCSALATTTLFSTLIDLKKINAATAASSSLVAGDYKAMVCIMLGGGNDSFNMLIPTGSTAYNHYSTTRSNLAIPQADILPLNGTPHGLHPSMTGIQNLFNSNKLSFISNVGTLIHPITKQQYWNETVDIPLGLYSHSDQAQQWQTSIPHDRTAIGWGGKVAELLQDMNGNSNISTNISLAGTNTFQKGASTVEYVIDPYNGSEGIEGYGGGNSLQQIQTNAVDHFLDKSYADMFQKSYIDVIKVAKDSHEEFSAAISGVADFNTTFSDNDISQSMHMIAKTIAARDTIGAQRQIFFVEFGGWDHHDEVLDQQAEMLTVLSDAMKEFNDAIEEISDPNEPTLLSDCVTTFTMSEFSRTLTSNGNGTDHAWGANVMAMGGPVNGGNIYGTYPSLELNGSIEVGGGVLIPSLSCDEYFAELALWFGVNSGALADIFPNLNHFYSAGTNNPPPIGFLNI